MSENVEPVPENTKRERRRQGVSAPVAVLAFMVLFAWIGWLYYHNFVPPSHPIGPSEESKHDWVAQAAVKAGGDPSKVDPAIMRKLNIFTGGRGDAMIKKKYYDATH